MFSSQRAISGLFSFAELWFKTCHWCNVLVS